MCSMKMVDSGLLTLSRYPIVAQDFAPYPHGVFSDSTCDKGVLYTAIEVSMGCKKEIVHVFNTHTQASYTVYANTECMAASLDTRQSQIKTAKDFIERKVKENGGTGLVLFCADLNVEDACTMKPKYREQAKTPYIIEKMRQLKADAVDGCCTSRPDDDEFESVTGRYQREYDDMMDVFDDGGW